jgi:hypothetical protein
MLLAGVVAGWVACTPAAACDGKSYTFPIGVGETVSGGGLVIRLDKTKFLNDVPDKYYISIKDDGVVLAIHALLLQHDTITFKTKCGDVSIGADRKSMFSSNSLTLNWGYF